MSVCYWIRGPYSSDYEELYLPGYNFFVFIADFLLFNPEDGGVIFFQNIS
jgi:hypothetical protein